MTDVLPRLVIDARDPQGEAKLQEFAAAHIGSAETVTIELAYTGHEQASDILTIDANGAILAAREPDA